MRAEEKEWVWSIRSESLSLSSSQSGAWPNMSWICSKPSPKPDHYRSNFISNGYVTERERQKSIKCNKVKYSSICSMLHRSVLIHFWRILCSMRWSHCVSHWSHGSKKMICSSWCWGGITKGESCLLPGQAPRVTWAVSLCQLPRPWDLDRLMKDGSNNFPFHHSRHKGIQTALCQNGNPWYLFSEEKSTVVVIGGCLGMTGTVCPSWTVTARG